MAHATHLYFDHPQEPDPEEKGLTWATRYIDDKKVFDYRPEDLFGNAKTDTNGLIFSGDKLNCCVCKMIILQMYRRDELR